MGRQDRVRIDQTQAPPGATGGEHAVVRAPQHGAGHTPGAAGGGRRSAAGLATHRCHRCQHRSGDRGCRRRLKPGARGISPDVAAEFTGPWRGLHVRHACSLLTNEPDPRPASIRLDPRALPQARPSKSRRRPARSKRGGLLPRRNRLRLPPLPPGASHRRITPRARPRRWTADARQSVSANGPAPPAGGRS